MLYSRLYFLAIIIMSDDTTTPVEETIVARAIEETETTETGETTPAPTAE